MFFSSFIILQRYFFFLKASLLLRYLFPKLARKVHWHVNSSVNITISPEFFILSGLMDSIFHNDMLGHDR
ncbi:MAG TPA: hypothetical protein DIS88_11605 [Prevotella sp.]|nr:hypothetical protein [Prevotella sp.]